MPITTATPLKEYLEKQGYHVQVSGESVFASIGASEAPYTAAFSFGRKGQLQITCQLALLGEFPESHLSQLALAALDANMQISPYAFAIIGAAEGEADVKKSPLVLIDTIPTSDLSEQEVGYAVDRLLEALTFSREILKLGLSPAK